MTVETNDKKCILGLGNPLLDILGNVSQDTLDKYGLTLDNAILAEDKHLPLYDEMLASPDVELVAGGATQNSIRIAQWMLNSTASGSGRTSFLGCVGKDDNGKKLFDCASADGVDVHYLEDESAITGTCAVAVKDGERTLVANLSAANCYKKEHLETEKSQKLINNAQVFYSGGFHLTVCPDAMVALGQHAAENNKVFSMNLSAPFLMQVPPFQEAMLKVFPYCDFIFANETEAAEFGKMQKWGEDLELIALKTSQMPKASGARSRVVVFTQGSKPSIVAQDGVVSTFETPALDASAIVDTNGAGDAFVGGFLASYVQDSRSMADHVKAGNYAAQQVIQRSGCTFPEKCEFTW